MKNLKSIKHRLNLRAVVVSLLLIFVLIVLELAVAYFISSWHHKSVLNSLLNIASRDAQLFSFKIDRRVELLETISQKKGLNDQNFSAYLEDTTMYSVLYAKGWIDLEGNYRFVKEKEQFNPEISKAYLDSVLTKDFYLSFLRDDERYFLSLTQGVYNKDKNRVGTLIAVMEDSILYCLPTEHQKAFFIVNSKGEYIKDMLLTEVQTHEFDFGVENDSSLVEKIKNELLSMDVSKKKAQVLKSNIDKRSAYYISIPLEYNDWFLISVYSDKAIDTHHSMFKILFQAMTLIFWVLLIGILFYSFILRLFFRSDLEAQLSYDSLTGAFTKDKLFLYLKNSYNPPSNCKVAFVVSNIKNFGFFNTVFGQVRSDEIIRKTKLYLTKKLKKEELLARSFADRFYLVLCYQSEEELNHRLIELSEELRFFNQDVVNGFPVNYCFGIYLTQKQGRRILSPEFFALADMAIKNNPKEFSKTLFYYDAEVQKSVEKEILLESRMEEALINEEFLVYLQPKYDANTEELVGAEALVRWQTPNELLFPDSFIPIFEKSGFILKLDTYMLEKVCQIQQQRLIENKPIVPISVNQSRLLLYQPDYLETLISIVDKYEVPRRLIELEMTETVVLENDSAALSLFNQLLTVGFRVSMDDFGSGYSSLNMLKEIDVNIIKLDRGFLQNTINSEKGKKVVISVLRLIKDLRLISIAEGVETKEELEFLRDAGCHFVQGYYFSKPIPLQEFVDKLETFPISVYALKDVVPLN